MRRRISGALGAAGQAGGADGGGSGAYVDDVFSTYLYEGNQTNDRAIVNGIDLAGEGGMVWIKSRTDNGNHSVFDTERGVHNWLRPNLSAEEISYSNTVTSFNADGFDVGTNNQINLNSQDYVSWTFRKAPKFFDVVTYTGDGVAGREIPHNLGIEPGMVIVKRTDSQADWQVYHRELPENTAPTPHQTKNLYLNTDQSIRNNNVFGAHSSQTGSSFTLGTNNLPLINESGGEYVAYLFAHDDSDESIIKCGSYTGNGSNDGPEIDLGFEPQWLMVKSATGDGDWQIVDTMRGISTDGNIKRLRANSSDGEITNSSRVNVTPTGFKITSNHPGWGGSVDYIYMAIRRPNKPAEEFEPEELFAVDSKGSTGDGKAPAWRSGFPVDMGIQKLVNAVQNIPIRSRLTGGNYLETHSTLAEQPSSMTFDYMNGYYNNTGTDQNLLSWMWRRAPGFFDVVCYEGDGQSGREVPHNLGVAPEMMWVKSRSLVGTWPVYAKSLGNTGALRLNFTGTLDVYSEYWNNTNPTSSVFTIGNDNNVNTPAETYIAYLFATVPGISKVGGYTGNGSEVTVDCGFTNGAKWLLIKKVNEAGDWYFTCNPNNFKVLAKLNTTEAQSNYTSTFNDVPSGFRVTSTSGNLCDDGAEYIFYAIA